MAGTWTEPKPANNRLTATHHTLHNYLHKILQDIVQIAIHTTSTQWYRKRVQNWKTQDNTKQHNCTPHKRVLAGWLVLLRTCVCQIHIVATNLNPSIDFDQEDGFWRQVSPKQEIKIRC